MYVGLELVWGNFHRFLVKAGLLPIVPPQIVVVSNLNALKALTTRPAIVITEGYTTANDGGGGPPWQWVASSTATIDDFMVVSPTGSPSGRYIRQLQDGGAVNPKWAGCGLGAADDSVQWQKVIDYGAAIDGANGAYPIDGLLVGVASTVPSIINCNFTPAPTATTASRLLRIDKTADIRLRNLSFVSPISSNPAVQPIVDLALFFNTIATISRVWVEDCRFVGGNDGMNFSGDFYSIFVENCLFESTWRGGSTITAPHYVSFIGCKFIGCGISDGTGAGASLSGALRLGSSTQAVTPELYEVIGCTFKDCCANVSQEALDLSGNAAKNVVVNGNNCSGCGNGFVEAKCATAGATSGDNVYRRFEFSGNNVELLAAGGIGFNLHTSDNATTAGKLGQVLITGNKVMLDAMPVSATSTFAAVINGWDDVTISANQFVNLGRGVELAGYGVSTDIISRITFLANDFYVFANCIYTSTTGGLTSTINDLVIRGNKMRAVQVVASFGATSPSLVGKLTFEGNTVISDTTNGLDIRNVTAAVIFGNTFDTDDPAILCQGATPGAIDIKGNLFRVTTGNALTLTTGTAITVVGNHVEVGITARTWAGAATVVAADNFRGTATADPSATVAGALGDVMLNSAVSVGGPKQWDITTAGNAGAAVWSPLNQQGGLQRVVPVVLGGAVALNNTANYFNGPNTGSIGAAGQVWLVFGNFTVSQTPSVGPDYYSAHIYNGTTIVGDEQVVTSVGAGVNVAGSCFAIVTLSAATTFTLRAKDATSVDGSLLAEGTSIGAVRLV